MPDTLVETVHAPSQSPNDSIETVRAPSLPPQDTLLLALDSLAWQQPDSALMCLITWFDTCRDVSRNVSTHRRHYAHILLAELLYKNDYEQTTRTELRQAVEYFDSLCNPCRDGACTVSTANNDIVFLSARAHYINGVGYYETYSIEEACAEYIKALETMENHFDEKDLVGNKARFMGLTFNRLLELFSDQYMPEPAISCARQALEFFRVAPLYAHTIPNTLYWIGLQYVVMGKTDSAEYYYAQALAQFSDTTDSYYRDIRSSMALFNYEHKQQGLAARQTLKQLADEAANEDERLTRYFTLGGIYFMDGLYDSALRYLQPVFDNKSDRETRLQAADFLSKIHDSLGEYAKAEPYIRFLAQNKAMDADNKMKASRLNTLFQDYTNRKQQRQAEAEQKAAKEEAVKRILVILLPAVLLVLAAMVWALRKRPKKHLKATETTARQQLEATRQQHKQQLQRHQAEASKMLDEAEERLQQQIAQTEALKLEMEQQKEAEKNTDKGEAFLDESVCLTIRDSVMLRSITTRDLPVEHKEVVLDEAAGLLFCGVVNRHFEGLEARLRERYPRIKAQDVLLCYLYLLDLDEKQMAALLNLTYGAVKKKTVRLQEYLKTDENLADFMKKQAGLR